MVTSPGQSTLHAPRARLGRRRSVVLLIVVWFAASAGAARAQSPAPAAPTAAATTAAPSTQGPGSAVATPCLSRLESRRFDFWAGEWDVTTKDGKAVGRSSVQPILAGCALLENWTNLRGGMGKSLNTYNAAEHMWQQFWVSQYGETTEYRESEWAGTTLQFLAHVKTDSGPELNRLSFTPLQHDLVRQHGEVSRDDGKTWSTTYDFYYHRRGPE